MFKKVNSKGTHVKVQPTGKSVNKSRASNSVAGRTIQNTRSNKKGGLSGK